MVELGASDGGFHFPVVYASAVNGYARYDVNDGNMDMVPLLDTILKEIPCPDVDVDGPVALQVCTVDHSSYEGRIGIGRLQSSTIHEKEQVLKSSNPTVTATTRRSARCIPLRILAKPRFLRPAQAILWLLSAWNRPTSVMLSLTPRILSRWSLWPLKNPPWLLCLRLPRVPWLVERAISLALVSWSA